jgi:hypothetical protein
MTGPHPAGAPWTAEDDHRLLAMVERKIERAIIARKLKRTPAAVHSRLSKLRKGERQKPTNRDFNGCEENPAIQTREVEGDPAS